MLRMMRWSFLLPVAMLFALPVWAGSTPEVGGKVGEPYSQECGGESLLIGFDYTSGKALDSVAAICGIRKNGDWTGEIVHKNRVGGYGGSGKGWAIQQKFVQCPPFNAVAGIQVFVDGHGSVRHFGIGCFPVPGPELTYLGTTNTGGEDRYDVHSDCPPFQFATGVYGHFAGLVNSMGLHCMAPVLKQAAPPPSNGVGAAVVDAIGGIEAAVADAAAEAAKQAEARKALEAQIAEERRVTGKTPEQCVQSNQQCEARVRTTAAPIVAPQLILAQCTPFFQQCMTNAATAQRELQAQIAEQQRVTGKTPEQCVQSNQQCEARVRTTAAPIVAPQLILAQCTPFFQQCMTNAAGAGAAANTAPAEQPTPGSGGGTQSASTCRLPGGTATVVIADPTITTLNVRDKPEGDILTTIPRGSQVTVVGGCGVKLSAGIVATKRSSEPKLGWCTISAPVIGCVKDDFLVAGIPSGGQAALPSNSAGLAANKPQTQTAPGVVVTLPGVQSGALMATTKRGTNIRSGPNSNGTKILGSLPAGITAPVIQCTSHWCRLALPQYPVAWAYRDYLSLSGTPASGPSIGVTINLGGNSGAGGDGAPAPDPTDGQSTAQTGLPKSAGLAANKQQTGSAPLFTGTWNANAQGSGYMMTLNQNGTSVSGSYTGGDGSSGQINGIVSGNVLRFSWQQTDGLSGSGKFALSADGRSFTGSYTLGNNPDVVEGRWNGTRR